MTTKQERQTRLTEMVETHNIFLSLCRLDRPPYDSRRKTRALYHAITMTGAFSSEAVTAIRVALNLP
jgi:hypothetical protein